MARTRATVLDSAADLLVEGGPNALTVDAVVAASGVAKSTIYRHWENRDELLLAALEHCVPPMATQPPGLDFAEALRFQVRAARDMMADPRWERVLPALFALRCQDRQVADLEDRIDHKHQVSFGATLEQGIVEGHLRADLDLDQARTVLMGPLVLANLSGRPALDDKFCDLVVEGFLRTFAPA